MYSRVEDAPQELPIRLDNFGPLSVITLGDMGDDCEVCRAIRDGKSLQEISALMGAPILKAGWGGL